MADASDDDPALELRRLELERFKARLDYRKFIWGSVFAAITVAAIPPLFQLATAYLEYVKSEAARLSQAQQFRDGYVKDFLNTALTQDIETRIRFAQYFSSVSSEKLDWNNYLKTLRELRDTKKGEIDLLEKNWQRLADTPGSNASEVNELKRHLDWAYSEVGYAAPNRSAIANPRAPSETKGPGISLTSLPPGRRDIAQKILDAFAAAGFGQLQQVAALANAIAESNLNPSTVANAVPSGESPSAGEVGLFLLSPTAGHGKGHTIEELKNPEINIRLVVEASKAIPAFSAAKTLDEAVQVFVLRIMRPANPTAEIIRRQQIARQLFEA
jgi:hypothetical protein